MAQAIYDVPPLRGTSPQEIAAWANSIKALLDSIMLQYSTAAQTYMVSNNSGAHVVRTLDCAAPVLATTTNVLGTLIQDLRNKGVLQ